MIDNNMYFFVASPIVMYVLLSSCQLALSLIPSSGYDHVTWLLAPHVAQWLQCSILVLRA